MAESWEIDIINPPRRVVKYELVVSDENGKEIATVDVPFQDRQVLQLDPPLALKKGWWMEIRCHFDDGWVFNPWITSRDRRGFCIPTDHVMERLLR